jgi:putative chitinase
MLLKNGSQGEDVKQLQIKLGVDPVGKFGPKTEAAVKAWQSEHGLTADGIVGPKTWAVIMGINDQVTEQVSAPVSAPIVITEPAPIKSIGGLKLENLKGHIPDSVIAQIPDTASKFELNTPLRLAHFLAQCGHESGGFKLVQENLNYGAKGLLGLFGKYFKDAGKAALYERKPEKIANLIYGGRMGNGSEPTGEGWKYHGRGFIQLTGKDNYSAFSKSIGEDCVSNPDLVATKYPLASAAWFFNKNGLHKIADGGSSEAVVTQITKRVNGGTIGLPDRIKHFKEFYNLLA